MTTATLTKIGPPSEPWGEHNLVFLDLTFEDHAPASLATNEQGLDARTRELTERIGKPAEYDFSENGRGGWKVKLPKPQEGQREAKRGYSGRPADERAEIMAQAMLKAAVDLKNGPNSSITFEDAVKKVQEGMHSLLAVTRSLVVEAGDAGGAGTVIPPVSSDVGTEETLAGRATAGPLTAGAHRQASDASGPGDVKTAPDDSSGAVPTTVPEGEQGSYGEGEPAPSPEPTRDIDTQRQRAKKLFDSPTGVKVARFAQDKLGISKSRFDELTSEDLEAVIVAKVAS